MVNELTKIACVPCLTSHRGTRLAGRGTVSCSRVSALLRALFNKSTNGQTPDISTDKRLGLFSKLSSDVVSSANRWNNRVKASQLVAWRISGGEVLQGIPSDKLADSATIENALEARFGDSHSHSPSFYRTGIEDETAEAVRAFQVLAADVELRPRARLTPSAIIRPRQPSSPKYFVCRRYQR
ncbi:hypothetical protein AVEN_266017-1 [Araneus ventricosus]|uniref:Uncharacterized protein n=1 Tax=Araneus ventricosus TaxID=182803 RepID=A0A4Y2SHS1_ARAVE|nr:hypothetical protein AVEN_266017-1 [Araneus ventricosus]